MTILTKPKLSPEERTKLLATLEARFIKNPKRHKGIVWAKVEEKIKKSPSKQASLTLMEQTGGEPDVIGYDKKSGEYLFCDCAPESPTGRRSLCFDNTALDSRKENKPEGSAVATAAAMGLELLTEKEYRNLQKVGDFDQKTSSWIATPASIRELGGALFCDRRYETVFTYHNGAESYYASRAFRGILRV